MLRLEMGIWGSWFDAWGTLGLFAQDEVHLVHVLHGTRPTQGPT